MECNCKQLKQRIEQKREELKEQVQESLDKNLDQEVLKVSQALDKLLNEYIKCVQIKGKPVETTE